VERENEGLNSGGSLRKLLQARTKSAIEEFTTKSRGNWHKPQRDGLGGASKLWKLCHGDVVLRHNGEEGDALCQKLKGYKTGLHKSARAN